MRAFSFAPLLAGFVAVFGACRHDDPIEMAHVRPATSTAAPPAAADQLRPGELAEGTGLAYGLAVPRDLRVVRRFEESIVAVGEPAAELVANFVRHRVEADAIEVGPARTVFAGARVKGDPEGKLLRIEVIQQPTRTELVVKDITPTPIEPDLTEEQRWQKAGLSPDGKQLNLRELQ